MLAENKSEETYQVIKLIRFRLILLLDMWVIRWYDRGKGGEEYVLYQFWRVCTHIENQTS